MTGSPFLEGRVECQDYTLGEEVEMQLSLIHSSSLHPSLLGTKPWTVLSGLLSGSWKQKMKKQIIYPNAIFSPIEL